MPLGIEVSINVRKIREHEMSISKNHLIGERREKDDKRP